MQKTQLHISLTIRGPLLTQSSSPGQLGLDVVVARNHNNKFYIPGTLVSGKIRQSLEELLDAVKDEDQPDWFAPKLDDWLGRSSENNLAKTKRLFFADFVLNDDNNVLSSSTRHRIKIDANRGAVSNNQLVMVENPFISGETYTFSGQIHYFSSKETAKNITQHLKASLKWLSQLGAFRSIGFGEVVNAEITQVESLPITRPEPASMDVSDRVGFSIQPEYPFCLAGKPAADNLFESEAIIPGGTIKGCIATTWNHLLDQQSGHIHSTQTDRLELRNNFSKLRISHAFPCSENNKRPVVAPLSLVKTTSSNLLFDVARLDKPCLINGQAPDFAVDWKDSAETLKDYPWPYIRFKDWGWDSMETELRVRTAIDRRKLRSAENKLFAYEQIISENKHWYGELNLSGIEQKQRNTLLEQLKTLCGQGLIGLGKTKAPFKIEFTDPIQSIVTSNPEPIDQNLWLITLQTDTLLGSPETLDESAGKTELQHMYQDTWQELSDDKLILLRYFARQRLSGGRFRQKIMQNNDDQYRPWLLTEAGSVFVLQANTNSDPKDIKPLITRWLSQGLPLSDSTVAWYRLGDDSSQYWKYTPFVPENGYGEISVNLQSGTITQLTDTDEIVHSINDVKCTPAEEHS